MPVPSTIADLSTVAADNSPQGSEPIGTSLDNYIRAAFAFIKQIYNTFPVSVANGGTGATTASAARTNLGLGSAATLDAGTSANNVVQLTAASALPNVPGAIPPGAIIFASTAAAPVGFLKANGAAVSRTTYAALFAALGTSYGVGDGSSTFNLPDLRGEFIRGHDDGRGADSGRVFGSFQDHAIQNHAHSMAYQTTDNTAGSAAFRTVLNTTATGNTGSMSTGNSASETRPRNIALTACIKY